MRRIVSSATTLSATTLLVTLLGAQVCAMPAMAADDGANHLYDKQLYDKHCAACHGEQGDGTGSAARFLYPKPRDFTPGVFKFRTTPSGTPPTDEDIYRSIKHGIAGTSMPGWDRMSETELRSMVAYVKSFSDVFASQDGMEKPIAIGKAPASSATSIAAGKKLYAELECNKCHGDGGQGDGPSASSLTDDWENPIVPYDLTKGPLLMKGGAQAGDIYRTLVAGLDGTPMPSFAEDLNPAQTWNVVHYIQSLSTVKVDEASMQRPTTPVLKASRTSVALTLNPQDAGWTEIPATAVTLRPMWAMEDWVKTVDVQVAISANRLMVRYQWQDDSENESIGNTTEFRDAIAMQHVPGAYSGNYLGLPFIGMGDDQDEVTIWQWKSDWQTAIDKDGFAMVKINQSATKTKRTSSVDVVKAKGFGTLGDTTPPPQDVEGKAVWKDGLWMVVMSQPISAESAWSKNKAMPVAIAAWNGAAHNRGVRKAVSSWMELQLD